MKRIMFFFSLMFFFNLMFAQNIITGLVTDESGSVIPGVTVLEKGTVNGTITDLDGRYSFNISTNKAVLIFSFVGFIKQEIQTEGKSQINVILKNEEQVIDEIVVLGYSTKLKNEIASAVTTIGANDLKDVTTNDVGTMLQGKVAGVQVVNSSGAPGAVAEVRIRGISTIKPGNEEPLYVVDGIIGGSFDPNDIESVTILKDAGATGMYGSRASKGVIIISTKSAQKGKISFNVKSNMGYKIANQGNLKMMNGEQFFDYSSEFYRNPETHQIDLIKYYQQYPRELKTRNFDWVNTAFHPSFIQNYYVSASGGNEKNSFFISSTFFNEGGTFKNTQYNKINLHINQKTVISGKINFTNNINITGTKGSYHDYMSMYYTYLSLPWDNGIDSNGNAVYIDATTEVPNAIPEGRWWSRDKINPLHSIDNYDFNSIDGGVSYDFVLNLKITDWLHFTSSNRLGFSSSKGHSFISPESAGTYHNKGWINETQNTWYSGITTNLFHFDLNKGKSNFSGLAGVEADKNFWESIMVQGTGLPNGFDVPEVASSQLEIGGSRDEGVIESIISQFNYNYDYRYFLTGSYRIDASSNFPKGNRLAKFPSLSASWLLSNEAFMKLSKIKTLKLRASWGITGDPEIGASRYMGLFSLSSQYNGQTVATPYQLSNYRLTWERTIQQNIGIDFGTKRMNFTIDAYNNITKDLIVLVAQPLSMGFEYRWENAGQVTNKGVEFAIDADIINNNNLKWNFNFSIARNSNKLSGFDEPIYRTVAGISQIYRNNGEIYTFMLPKWLGVDTETGAPMWEKITKDDDGNIISRTPSFNYAEAGPQEVGKALPDFQGGFGTTVTFKRFSFYINFAYQYGNEIYNFTRMAMDNDGHEPYYNVMVPKDDWSRWEKPGDVATHPSMQNAPLSNQISSRYIEDGGFLKIRNIMLSYSLPVKKMKSINAIDISLGIDNLKSFTNFWGQDPEAALSQGEWSMPGVSDFKYPISTQFVLNANFRF